MEVPSDFSYQWESVGAGYLCEMCPITKIHNHLWRAHSEKYGDVYVCPRHLHHMGTMYRGERDVVWLLHRKKAGVK